MAGNDPCAMIQVMDRRAFTGMLAAGLLAGAWGQTTGKVARIA